MLQADFDHQIETVGERLRSRMSWLHEESDKGKKSSEAA
jgi:hypothetical protein